MDKRTRKKLEAIQVARSETEIYAFLGDLRTGQVEVDPNVFTHVYATVAFTGQVIKVRNYKYPNRFRLPVKIGGKDEAGVMQVIGKWKGIYPDLDLPEVPKHPHTWGQTENPAWIRKEQILELLPSAVGGMTVRVNAGYFKINSVLVGMNTTEFDMTSYIPSSGAKWVSVSVDIDGNITYTEGDTVESRLFLEYANVPQLSLDYYLLFAVKMYSGQDAILYEEYGTDIFDPRFVPSNTNSIFIDPDPTMAADSDDVVPSQSAVIDYVASKIDEASVSNFVRKFPDKAIAPTSSDDIDAGYLPTDVWLDNSTTPPTEYVCVDNSAGAAVWLPSIGGGSGDLHFRVDGYLAVAGGVYSFVIPKDMTIDFWYIHCENKGTAGVTKYDVNVNGSTIFSTASNRPELAWDAVDDWAKSGVPDIVDFSEGDIITIDIDEVATDAEGLVGSGLVSGSGGGGGGGSFNLTIEDGTTSVSNVSQISIEGTTVSDEGGGVAKITIVDPAMVLLDTKTASSSADLRFTGLQTSVYKEFLFKFHGVIPATNSVDLYCQLSTDGGTTYDSTSLYVLTGFINSQGGTAVFGQAPGSPVAQFRFRNATFFNNNANYGAVGEVSLIGLDSTTLYKRLMFTLNCLTAVGNFENIRGSGVYKSTTAVDAVRFYFSTGNIASGTIRMYGVKV